MTTRFLILSFSLLFFIINSHAQDQNPDSSEGWEIVERCVGEPITAPDDWTFDGTILASGWAGIHRINADWDVPGVLAFREDTWLDILSSYSPDYQWYAVAQGRLAAPRCPLCSSATYYWDNVTVYSTTNPDESYTYTLNTTFSYYPVITNNQRLVWYDNNHLVLVHDELLFLWNPSDGKETELEPAISPLIPIDKYFPSPDRTVAIYQSPTGFNVISPETGEILQEYEGTPSLFSKWSPNNQYFASYPDNQLLIYSLQTGEIDLVWHNFDGSSFVNFEWSSNSRYLYFQEKYFSEGTQAFIVDMETQEIFSLCRYFESWARSSSANQLSVTLADDNAIYF